MKIQTIITTIALAGAALPALALQFPDPVRPLAKGEPGYELQQQQRAAKQNAMDDCPMIKGKPCTDEYCLHKIPHNGKAKR